MLKSLILKLHLAPNQNGIFSLYTYLDSFLLTTRKSKGSKKAVFTIFDTAPPARNPLWVGHLLTYNVVENVRSMHQLFYRWKMAGIVLVPPMLEQGATKKICGLVLRQQILVELPWTLCQS